MENRWSGYVWFDNELRWIEFIRDGEYVNAWLGTDGNLMDDHTEKEDFKGLRFYNTIQDFGVDDWLSLDEVWPE